MDLVCQVSRLAEHFPIALDGFRIALKSHVDHPSIVVICGDLQGVGPVVDRSYRVLNHLKGLLEAACLETEHGKLRV